MPDNGHYVTRGEFNIVYDLLKNLSAKVDLLVAAQAADKALDDQKDKNEDRKVVWFPAVLALFVSATTTMTFHWL